MSAVVNMSRTVQNTFQGIQVYGSLFLLGCVGIILLVLGGVYIRKPKDTTHTSKMTGTFSNVVCASESQCSAILNYTVPCSTANCTSKFTLSGTWGKVSNGDSADVYYNPNNPADAVKTVQNNKTTGIILLSFGGFTLLISMLIAGGYTRSLRRPRVVVGS